MNTCSKPGCGNSAIAILSYDYSSRLAFLDDPEPGTVSPHVYALCVSCSDRLAPPRGWLLDDRRSEPPLFVRTEPRPDFAAASASDDADADADAVAAPARRQMFFGYSGS